MSDVYNTIDNESYGEFKDRGSKFLAFLYPIETVDELNDYLQLLRSEHPKANHHCPAIRLLDGYEKSSDDGEPSGSAGKPILNQLRSANLKNVGCIVVRYFGGTKLGVSGLINAYKQSTKLAINAADIKEAFVYKEAHIAFDYAIMGKLMKSLKDLKLLIGSKDLCAEPSLCLLLIESTATDDILRLKAHMLKRSIEDVDMDTEISGIKNIELTP